MALSATYTAKRYRTYLTCHVLPTEYLGRYILKVVLPVYF